MSIYPTAPKNLRSSSIFKTWAIRYTPVSWTSWMIESWTADFIIRFSNTGLCSKICRTNSFRSTNWDERRTDGHAVPLIRKRHSKIRLFTRKCMNEWISDGVHMKRNRIPRLIEAWRIMIDVLRYKYDSMMVKLTSTNICHYIERTQAKI